MAKADARTQLLVLLQTLRKQIASGPKHTFPVPKGFRTCPGAGYFTGERGIAETLEAIRKLRSDDGKHPYLHDASIAQDTTQGELKGVLMLAYELPKVPAPEKTIEKLDAVIKELGGKAPSGAAGRKRRRASDKPRKQRPLTQRQSEVVQIVGECKGNLAESARRLGRDRKTIEDTYRAAMDKLGKTVYRSKDRVGNTTKLHARDRRGQDDISTDNRRS